MPENHSVGVGEDSEECSGKKTMSNSYDCEEDFTKIKSVA